jgi:octaprenyl-diphosphate synthase
MKKLQSIYTLVENERKAIDAAMIAALESPLSVVEDIGHYIVDQGGKKLRSLFLLLIANALGYQGSDHIRLGVVIELIHTATLLHDDVIDDAAVRRGKKTAHLLFTPSHSILVGDFLYSRAFELMVAVGNMDVMACMAKTTNEISQGEILQLIQQDNAALSMEDYEAIIRAKTAILFSASSQLAGLVSRVSKDIQQKLVVFGESLGMIYQMVDDLLDYTATSKTLGKIAYQDFRESKMTLPLMLLLQASQEKEKIIAMFHKKIAFNEIELAEIFSKTDAFSHTKKIIQEKAAVLKKTLAIFPENKYREALSNLIEVIVEREY